MTRSRSRVVWIGVDVALARRLVSVQFPEWAHLTIKQLFVPRTDNVNFRLGDEHVVRIPWRRSSSRQVIKEWRWLPRLAPLVSLPIPEPVSLGRASEMIPWRWSIVRWIEGEPLDLGTCDLDALTTALAAWVHSLHAVDLPGGPPAGAQNGCRGTSLHKRDAHVRSMIATNADLIDVDAVTASWNESLKTPRWSGRPRGFTATCILGTCSPETSSWLRSSTSAVWPLATQRSI